MDAQRPLTARDAALEAGRQHQPPSPTATEPQQLAASTLRLLAQMTGQGVDPALPADTLDGEPSTAPETSQREMLGGPETFGTFPLAASVVTGDPAALGDAFASDAEAQSAPGLLFSELGKTNLPQEPAAAISPGDSLPSALPSATGTNASGIDASGAAVNGVNGFETNDVLALPPDLPSALLSNPPGADLPSALAPTAADSLPSALATEAGTWDLPSLDPSPANSVGSPWFVQTDSSASERAGSALEGAARGNSLPSENDFAPSITTSDHADPPAATGDDSQSSDGHPPGPAVSGSVHVTMAQADKTTNSALQKVKASINDAVMRRLSDERWANFQKEVQRRACLRQ